MFSIFPFSLIFNQSCRLSRCPFSCRLWLCHSCCWNTQCDPLCCSLQAEEEQDSRMACEMQIALPGMRAKQRKWGCLLIKCNDKEAKEHPLLIPELLWQEAERKQKGRRGHLPEWGREKKQDKKGGGTAACPARPPGLWSHQGCPAAAPGSFSSWCLASPRERERVTQAAFHC